MLYQNLHNTSITLNIREGFGVLFNARARGISLCSMLLAFTGKFKLRIGPPQAVELFRYRFDN